MSDPKVLIVTEHTSAVFGGEAVLPLHYFRELRARGLPVWLLTHARTRDELTRLFPGETRIHYIEDTAFHVAMWRIGKFLPDQVSYLTTGFLSRVHTQLKQRVVARRLVREHAIDVVHQPIPVSPREPSLLHGLGAPVVIGPMNGGMDYPVAFRHRRSWFENLLVTAGRVCAKLINRVVPGKRRAALLLVANQRTRDALAVPPQGRVAELVENGVDLSVWTCGAPVERPGVPNFVFMGRLVAWKSVDLLLSAFSKASKHLPMRLTIIGDGDERESLEAFARSLGLPLSSDGGSGTVHFVGWLTQAECRMRLDAAHVLVLPSLLECGGAVVLEAMALAKPVIATAWGGPLDYLDSSCGVLVPPNSREALIEGLATAIVDLASSPERRARLGARGAEKIREQYDWRAKVSRMLEFYELARRSSTAAPPKGPVRLH